MRYVNGEQLHWTRKGEQILRVVVFTAIYQQILPASEHTGTLHFMGP